MITIGVDTSSLQGSIALFKNEQPLDSRTWNRLNTHCESLSVSFSDLLQAHSLKVEQINRLAVGIGPGSFTGIRVAINFVRALSYSLKIPVYVLNSLKLMASQLSGSEALPLLSLQYGFRNLIYVGRYRLDKGRVIEKQPPSVMTVESILSEITEPHITVGSGFSFCANLANPNQINNFVRQNKLEDDPHALFFKNTSALDQRPDSLYDWSRVIPLYLRMSEAEEKLKSRG